ncbi:MAG: terpene cyclase/mutase family protein, partial [Planctomycetes bacterium]|nr:terpene cyclase/mutase family protein [Planctomycetota bacterium]
GVKGFDERVAALLDTVRADVFPQHLAATVAEQVDGWLTSGQIPGLSPAGDALVELVAAQFANRQLDRRSDPAGAGVAVFTATQQRAFDWLLAQQKDGVFSVNFGGQMYPDPSLTGFGLLALQTKPRAMRSDGEQNVIESGLRWLLAQQRDDGTFGEDMANYTTCVAVAALSRWDDPAVAPAMQKAQKAILAFQHLESTGFRRGDRDYGSIGYGDSQRGDLSNLHFSIGALRATGLPADDEALQKAIVFLQRTQNLKSVNDFKGRIPDPSNDSELVTAVSGNDGGATYYPGDSNAGYDVQPDGSVVARSYGSMTYALLKAYTLLGLSGSDPRVQAAVDWIRDHWSLETNPGADPSLGEKAKYQGVFYGYMVLAQALAAAGIDELEVAQEGGAQKEVGQKAAAGDADAAAATARIDWRHALRQHLERTQQQDGTWVNDKNGRWMEDRPLLCTCYALVALELCNGHGR